MYYTNMYIYIYIEFVYIDDANLHSQGLKKIIITKDYGVRKKQQRNNYGIDQP